MKSFVVFAAIIALAVAGPIQTTWTLHELSEALQNPNTDPALIPYLEHALNQIMDALFSGIQVDSVSVPLPAEIVNPVEAAPVQASSPLVQIIVNVNQQGQAPVVPSPVPSPAVFPEIVPTPVIVVDEPFEPIDVSPAEVDIVPEPVIVEPIEVNPIDVIAVGAIEYNPVDHLNPLPVNPAGADGIIV